jgi:hypothetical protein
MHALGSTPVLCERLEPRELLSAAAPAGHDDPRVYAPHSTVRGQTLGQWSAAWLQWALSAPNSQSPLLDATGANAGVGQPGDVFFLAGNTGGPTTRQFTVPTGTPLFFPVVNEFWVNVNVPGGDPPFAGNEANIRADFDAAVAAYTGLFATIDGAGVGDLGSHVETDPPGGFQVDFPQDNLFGFPPEVLGRSATEGIYLMTQPLAPGRHVIHFGGTSPLDQGFSLDVTDVITVVPKGQYRNAEPVISANPTGTSAAAAANDVASTRRARDHDNWLAAILH